MKPGFLFDTRNSDFVMAMDCIILTTKKDKKVGGKTYLWANSHNTYVEMMLKSPSCPSVIETKHLANNSFNLLIIN
jgi:hypothetical protein